MDEEILKTLKSIERLLHELNKKILVPASAPYIGDVPPYRPNPYWPYNSPVSWRQSSHTNHEHNEQ